MGLQKLPVHLVNTFGISTRRGMPLKRAKKIKKYTNKNVQVVVRCRPMNNREKARECSNIVKATNSKKSITIFNPKEKESCGKTYTFDAVYDCDSTQEQIYKRSVQPVIESVLNGSNGTILAYGQTGTGKTYTMEGNPYNPSEKGIISYAFQQIFNFINQSHAVEYRVRVSYIHIYMEKIKDLLSDSQKKTYEFTRTDSGVQIKGLRSHICNSADEMEAIMKYGSRNRTTGSTNMNNRSSRSHAVFIVFLEKQRTSFSTEKYDKVAKLNLVDLAGSERQTKSCASGIRLQEASKINLALSALGNVISVLTSGKNVHVPYRDSKLTQLLENSLGGNSKTLIIANIGPACYNYTESLSTLQYANRAKNIKNKQKDKDNDQEIEYLQERKMTLKALIEAKRAERDAAYSKSENQLDDPAIMFRTQFIQDIKKLLLSIEQKIRDKITIEEHYNEQRARIDGLVKELKAISCRTHLLEEKLIDAKKAHDKVTEEYFEEIEKSLEIEKLYVDLQSRYRNLCKEIQRIQKDVTEINEKREMEYNVKENVELIT